MFNYHTPPRVAPFLCLRTDYHNASIKKPKLSLKGDSHS